MSEGYVYEWIKKHHSPWSASLVFSYGGWGNEYSSAKHEIYYQHQKPIWHKGLLADGEEEKQENDTE